ncbi:MAG: response regulator [Elusimicrobia bacterium]|nr:response regulator [Elusimicrobiota bacterium]MBD3412279.1 response regulator [Elusimicrobiota bacterium]
MNTILLVDDDDGIRENLDLRLKSQKFDVCTARNGDEALDLIKKKKADLVLLDVMMPGKDGFTTCKEIKELIAPEFIPVIMLTALNHTEEKVKGLASGADDFVSKPFEEKELIARINAFLRIKVLHDQLEKSYAELKQLQAIKENLTHLIIHDMRSPVSSIIASLSLFEQKHNNIFIPDLIELFSRLRRNCSIQLNLVSDILEIGKMENQSIQLKKSTFSASALIDDCFAEAETSAMQKNISLHKDCPKQIKLYADQYYIRRVLMNLINNSLKYTDRDGSITVSVTKKNDAKDLLLAVHDSGQGIPAEDLTHIFDRYFQADATHTGARRSVGLGLSFCRMAVEAHGGRIWAESSSDTGSTFVFTIPGKA